MCVSRFLAANNLVHCVVTHKAQRPPEEVHEDARSHLALAVPKFVGPTCNPRFILIMDQTNSKFGNLPCQTINERGACTINMRTGTNDSKYCIVALTVSASGEMLTSMVVFKGARRGRIAACKIRNHPQGVVYTLQLKA